MDATKTKRDFTNVKKSMLVPLITWIGFNQLRVVGIYPIHSSNNFRGSFTVDSDVTEWMNEWIWKLSSVGSTHSVGEVKMKWNEKSISTNAVVVPKTTYSQVRHFKVSELYWHLNLRKSSHSALVLID